MENIYIRGIAGAVIGLASYFFGALDALLTALLAMMAIDFATGIIKAVVFKELDSRKMSLGGARKVGIMLVVAVSNVIDGILELGGLLRTVTISYFIANEGISLLENWSLMGLPVPVKLRNVLAQLRGNDDAPGDKEV
ncbi:MAG: phage holin family protein [Defluviitaleaceae bacterium]|nr:phage holin family protein [Defluviitaleaceae bacterium]